MMIDKEIDMTDREELACYIYEAHKDAYGVKGRHYDFDSMSIEELRKEADRISDAVAEEIAREKEAAARAVVDFEKEVQAYIELGAGDRQTALRWMTQNLEFYHIQDIEHWVWEYGILFTDEGRELVEELKTIITLRDWETE